MEELIKRIREHAKGLIQRHTPEKEEALVELVRAAKGPEDLQAMAELMGCSKVITLVPPYNRVSFVDADPYEYTLAWYEGELILEWWGYLLRSS